MPPSFPFSKGLLLKGKHLIPASIQHKTIIKLLPPDMYICLKLNMFHFFLQFRAIHHITSGSDSKQVLQSSWREGPFRIQKRNINCHVARHIYCICKSPFCRGINFPVVLWQHSHNLLIRLLRAKDLFFEKLKFSS